VDVSQSGTLLETRVAAKAIALPSILSSVSTAAARSTGEYAGSCNTPCHGAK
jgi:hypothetical protein